MGLTSLVACQGSQSGHLTPTDHVVKCANAHVCQAQFMSPLPLHAGNADKSKAELARAGSLQLAEPKKQLR